MGTGKASILICEDEAVVAMGIQSKLESFGYNVVDMVTSGEEAVKKTEELNPGLVLMDIVLKGDMDGVEAADIIKKRFHIPVIFLTAYSDDKTMERAKITEPFGYLIKPFQDKELYSTIEISLYKHKIDMKIQEQENRLRTILRSVGDSIVTIDTNKKITYMNPAAESLTGWKKDEAIGKDWKEVYRVIKDTAKSKTDQDNDCLPCITYERECSLIAKNGRKITVQNRMNPIVDDAGKTIGIVLVLRDISEKKQAEDELRFKEGQLDSVLKLL